METPNLDKLIRNEDFSYLATLITQFTENSVNIPHAEAAATEYLALRTRLTEQEARVQELEVEKQKFAEVIGKFYDFCNERKLGKLGENYSDVVLRYAKELESGTRTAKSEG